MILDKRIEKNIASISALRNLLLLVIKDPDSYRDNLALKEALISQGKLARYENQDLNIFATSINTMKRLSSYPNCDFEELNKLRIAALDKFRNQASITKNKNSYNKKDLSEKIFQLEKELNLNRNTQLLLLKLIGEIQSTIKLTKTIENKDEIKEHLDFINQKIKKVMVLEPDFIISSKENNVITHNFRKEIK